MPELIPFTLILFYLLPFLLAAARGHDMLIPILVVNVLLGWTIVGWLVILIAAICAPVDAAPAQRRS